MIDLLIYYFPHSSLPPSSLFLSLSRSLSLSPSALFLFYQVEAKRQVSAKLREGRRPVGDPILVPVLQATRAATPVEVGGTVHLESFQSP